MNTDKGNGERFNAETKSKDLTQRTQRKGGEKSEKDRGVYRRDAEGAEKTCREKTGSSRWIGSSQRKLLPYGDCGGSASVSL
jgi:hypothetical protein